MADISSSSYQQHTSSLNPKSIAALLGAVVAGGLVSGLALFLVSQYVPLILLQLLVGVLVGAFMLIGVRLGKVRHGRTAIRFAVMAGLLAYGAYRYLEYYQFRQETKDIFREEFFIDDSLTLDMLLDEFLQQETGSAGLLGFIRLQAADGIHLSSAQSRGAGGGISLYGPLAVMYWLVELGVLAAIPALIAYRDTKRAFSEEANNWVRYRTIGRIPYEALYAFFDHFDQGDIAAAAEHMVNSRWLPTPYLYVQAGEYGPTTNVAHMVVWQVNRYGREVYMEKDIPLEVYQALLRVKP